MTSSSKRCVEFDGDARAVLAAAAAAADEDERGFAFGGDLSYGGRPEFGVILGERGKVGDEDLVDDAGDFGGDRRRCCCRGRAR